jgi:hypothetical protein
MLAPDLGSPVKSLKSDIGPFGEAICCKGFDSLWLVGKVFVHNE